jgi:hypothetical protein
MSVRFVSDALNLDPKTYQSYEQVESTRWEGPREPGCGAPGVTLFPELKSVKHLFWKVLEVCVHTAVCTHGCVPG